MAWESNDPDDIAALFTEDARYYAGPGSEPWEGQEDIVAEWLRHKDEPGTWTFRYEVFGVIEGVGLVRGWRTYTDGDDYDDLWIVRLDGDRCTEFTEWFMVAGAA